MEVTGYRDFKTLGGAQRDDAVRRALVGLRQAAAHVSEMVAAVDRSRSFTDDAHRSTRAWFKAVANCSGSYASRMVHTARMIGDLEHVAGEIHDGELGECQIGELLRLFANDKCRAALGRGQYVLVPEAQNMRFDDFRKVADRFRNVVDPDGNHREHAAAHEGRHVAAGIVGKSMFLKASCGTAQGAEMLNILDRFAHAEYLADLVELKQRCGENAPLIMMRRTPAQRRLDALHKIFITAATNPAGRPNMTGTSNRKPNAKTNGATGATDATDATDATEANAANGTGDQTGPDGADAVRVAARGLARPVVNFVTDPDTFTDAVTRACGGGVRTAAEMTEDELWKRVRNYRSQTTDGVDIDPYLIVAAAINGRVRGIIAGASGVVIDAGRTRRFFTGAQRDILQALWERCFWPGCDVPGDHCQIDHLIGFTWPGGETRASNAAPGCGGHNRDKEHGFRVWLDPNGNWHVYRPDGTEIAPLGPTNTLDHDRSRQDLDHQDV